MACVAQQDRTLGLDIASLKITRTTLASPPSGARIIGDKIGPKFKTSKMEDVHNAVRFLQEEHEKVLNGLHQQVESLQHRCDDLQFEAHLRHLLTSDEESTRKKMKEMSKELEERTKEVEEYKRLLEEREMILEEERQKFRWKELQMQQQIEINDQRSAEMKYEIVRLRAQVRDLQEPAVQASGSSLMSQIRGSSSPSGSNSVLYRANSGSSISSQESFTMGAHRSVGLAGSSHSRSWRDGRYRSSRPGSLSMRVQSSNSNLGSSYNRSQDISLRPNTGGSPRPSSGSLVLPPISHSQSITRPQIRKQLRLSSAPTLDASPRRTPWLPP